MAAQGLKDLAGTKAPKFGHFIVEFATPGIGHILKSAGCDFVLFDLEHSGFGFETVKSAIRYFEAADLPVIVRVPSKDYHHVARAMDMGAEASCCRWSARRRSSPHHNSMKYTPEGGRGVALQVAHDRYRPGTVMTSSWPRTDAARFSARSRPRRASRTPTPSPRCRESIVFGSAISIFPSRSACRENSARGPSPTRSPVSATRRQAWKIPWAPGSDGSTGARPLRSGLRLHLLLRRRLGAARRSLRGDRQTAGRLRGRREGKERGASDDRPFRVALSGDFEARWISRLSRLRSRALAQRPMSSLPISSRVTRWRPNSSRITTR